MSISIHDPSASSSSSSTAAPADSATTSTPTVQSEARRLTALKDSIETRLDVYYSVLKTNNVNMQSPLVDPEGFPRSDIDVAGVRTARVQIIRLKNDLKAAMDEMAGLLERGLPREVVKEGMEVDAVEKEGQEQAKEPWVRVDGVFPGGPAAAAGLQRGDVIVALGTLGASSSLQDLAGLVNSSENMALPIVVVRDSQTLHLRLTPRSGWGGRGLLGFVHFI
ncbi:26S proteasome non-atpase regulatory subunit 9 [Pseudohyphozyma bogoriensis]|nr:26S proteasome non-atpase regulatory subunit 9 [Pseudohyphozyma bogoriensis]